jgi:anaerobic ribonucleoside-triphosphate reductase activating protein
MPASEDINPETVGKSRDYSKKPLTTPQMPTPDGYIRLSGPIEHDNIVNGDGLRAVIWTQGCRQRCPGCQNPETWDETSGILVPIDEVKDMLRKLKGQTGVTFCGGEPLLQAKACKEIADWAREELGWNIWSFTGLTFEKIREADGAEWDFVRGLDALIDGPYIQSQRDLTMKFRGSRNQRILYLKDGEIVGSE